MQLDENLDAVNDEAELLAYADAFEALKRYSQCKARAVRVRKLGKIDAALRIEESVDKLYLKIPVWARSW